MGYNIRQLERIVAAVHRRPDKRSLGDLAQLRSSLKMFLNKNPGDSQEPEILKLLGTADELLAQFGAA